MTVLDYLRGDAAGWGIILSGQALERFERYGQILCEVNQVMNLTAVTDPEGIARRHFLDSLRPLALGWIPAEASLVDVGTGAGFPGLPLAIARSDLHVTLADSQRKRVDFLSRVVEELGMKEQVKLEWVRAEDMGRQPMHREHYDVACARAVASLAVLAEYLLPLVTPGGAMLAWKGPSLPEEMVSAQRALDLLGGGKHHIDPYTLSGGEQSLCLAKIIKSRPTPNAYPRRAGKPAQQPL